MFKFFSRLFHRRAQGRALRIVTLLEPELCEDCRFARIARDEREQPFLVCTRLDCDNWDYQTLQSPTLFQEQAAQAAFQQTTGGNECHKRR